MGHGDPTLRPAILMMKAADRLAACVAIAAIRLYQFLVSRWLSRTCLFSPSCSRQAVAYFKRFGFAAGLKLTRRRLDDCNGDYSMRLGKDGAVELITRNGRVAKEPNINPRIAARMHMPWLVPSQTNPEE